MKEREFLDFIETMQPDAEADRRIIDQLMNYDGSAGSFSASDRKKLIYRLKDRFNSMKTLPKVASVLLLLSVIGTASAFAAGFLVKTYPAQFGVLEEDYESLPKESISRTSIKGSEPIKNENGVVIGYETIPNAAEEAFELIGLPNLVPTYLLENYYVDEDGYVIRKDRYGDYEATTLKAFFTSDPQFTKQVFLWVDPLFEGSSAKNVRILTEEPGDRTLSTYVTKSGLICTIVKQEDPYLMLNAVILFDSDTIGNVMYRLEFSREMDMDEVEAILESIPLSGN